MDCFSCSGCELESVTSSKLYRSFQVNSGGAPANISAAGPCQVSVIRQTGTRECRLGQTFSCDSPRRMWVAQGCTGIFMLGDTRLACGTRMPGSTTCICRNCSLPSIPAEAESTCLASFNSTPVCGEQAVRSWSRVSRAVSGLMFIQGYGQQIEWSLNARALQLSRSHILVRSSALIMHVNYAFARQKELLNALTLFPQPHRLLVRTTANHGYRCAALCPETCAPPYVASGRLTRSALHGRRCGHLQAFAEVRLHWML